MLTVPLLTEKTTVDWPTPELEPSSDAMLDDNDVQLTLKVSVSSPPKLLAAVATILPEREPPLPLIEMVPMPALFVVKMAVNMSVLLKLLCSPIPVVVKPPLVLAVTVPVHGVVLAPHEKSMEPALALGTNTATAKRQATARPDLRMILTIC